MSQVTPLAGDCRHGRRGRRRRGGHLLDPRPRSALLGAIGMVLGAQRGALRALAGADHALPGRVLRAAGRAVHRHGADHRLHRRDHDAVPVRADAGRPGRLGLADRDAARPADGRGRSSASASPAGRHRRVPGAAAATPRSAWSGQRGRATSRASPRCCSPSTSSPSRSTSALLITAAVGAMVLAHVERRKVRQARPAVDRMRARFAPGNYPGPKPGPGVFATSSSVATPALLPDGTAVRTQHLRRSCRPGS